MLNDAAKKQVARAARVAAGKGNRDRIALGANTDEICAEEWQTAQTHNPDFRDWPSAKGYFESVFYNEIDRDLTRRCAGAQGTAKRNNDAEDRYARR